MPPDVKSDGRGVPWPLNWLIGLSLAVTAAILATVIFSPEAILQLRDMFRNRPSAKMKQALHSACVQCHLEKTPGVVADWRQSAHARAGVGCDQCHRANDDRSVLRSHLPHDRRPISVVVSPVNCKGCHADQVMQFARSKHAATLTILAHLKDPWIVSGLAHELEQQTGCLACHGSRVTVSDGRPSDETWPNVGVGRINPDGSRGSCSACHTRHRFSIVEARKPEACDQCHLGPDHPQIEIYNESKHGTLYHAEGDHWRWRPDGGKWQAGIDYRAPTCASCHMSAAGSVAGTHDTGERLAWELQTPLSIRPSAFDAFPSTVNWQRQREQMKAVCRQCHGQTWTDAHFSNLDRAVRRYNEVYFQPARQLKHQLARKGLLHTDPPLATLWQRRYYEFWHMAGRRARMGAAMMAPDYAWWHGFYELKKGLAGLQRLAEDLQAGKAAKNLSPLPGGDDGPALDRAN